MKLNLGEIRYTVYEDERGPWVCRLRLVSFSPKGVVARWSPIDSRDAGHPVTFRRGDGPVSTPIEAIEEYQRWEVATSFPTTTASLDRRVRNIVAAEALKDAYRVPMPVAVASTG